MTRAVVIKTIGEPAIAGAIVDGMTRRVIPLDDGELAAIKAEIARLKARDAVRAYADGRRWPDVCAELEAKYSTRPENRLTGAVLGAWACVWSAIFATYCKLSAWNREG